MFVYKNHISLYLKIFYFQLKLVWPISPPALHSLCMAHTHPTNYDLDNAALAIAASGCLRLRIQWWGMSFSSKPLAWCRKRGVTLPSQPAADVRKNFVCNRYGSAFGHVTQVDRQYKHNIGHDYDVIMVLPKSLTKMLTSYPDVPQHLMGQI